MTDAKPLCPNCGAKLKAVNYPSGSYLNRDQWASVRAGDWYCESCKGTRARTGYRYFWNRELTPAAPVPPSSGGEPQNFTQLRELAIEARAALRRVAPPFSPEQDRDGLYYPLLFLVEQVEATLRAVLRRAFDETSEENTAAARWIAGAARTPEEADADAQ